MDIRDWLELIVEFITGLAIIIPLVIELVKKTKEAIKEKNWSEIVKVAIDLMVSVEGKHRDGEEKKAWVLEGVRVASQSIDYNYDAIAEQKISDMIDAVCKASKSINV